MSQANRFFIHKTDIPTSDLVPVTVKIDRKLVERVKIMKALIQQKSGGYFSLSIIFEVALESALRQAERELAQADEDGDEITIL